METNSQNTSSSLTNNKCSQHTLFDRAEFISLKTDTKQRLGELFTYNPTKLEMFGLRQQMVYSKIPKFEHPKPMFELDYQPEKQTTQSWSDCQKFNHSISKVFQPKNNHEQLHMSVPELTPIEKIEQKKLPPKELQNHIARKYKNLPPMLQHPFVSPPPFEVKQERSVRENKHVGKLTSGRISKKVDNNLFKAIMQGINQQKYLMEERSHMTKSNLPLKYQNLKRSQQQSLSQTIKQEKYQELMKNKISAMNLYQQKEKEINQIIFGNNSSMEEFL